MEGHYVATQLFATRYSCKNVHLNKVASALSQAVASAKINYRLSSTSS